MKNFIKELGLSVGCATALGATIGLINAAFNGLVKPEKTKHSTKLAPVS